MAWSQKIPVVTLVERGGKSRSVKAENVTAGEIRRIVLQNADTKSALMTDEANAYRNIGKRFASHESVNHSKDEYVRGDAHVNTAEGFFSIFKRGMVGVYQHCGEQHLHRYLAEFDFRYSNRIKLGIDDTERTRRAIQGAGGKRLTYRRTRSQERSRSRLSRSGRTDRHIVSRHSLSSISIHVRIDLARLLL